VLRTRVRAGAAAGLVLSMLFAAIFTAVGLVDVYLPSLSPQMGAPAPTTLRVPYGPRIVHGSRGGRGTQLTYEHARVIVPRGTVLDEGEDPTSERVRLAGGPGTALAWHGAYEFGGQEAVGGLPGGDAWNEVVNRTPHDRRHIAVHTGHCVELNEADHAAWDAGGHELLRPSTLSGTSEEVRAKLDDLAERGVTEIVFQPCGPDVRRELERFLDVASRSAAAVAG